MMRNSTAKLLLIVLLLGCLFARPSAADAGRCTLTVKNGTGREFNRLHISWSRDKDWGPNILQAVLKPGGSVVQPNMIPAEYDLLLVDGNGGQCTLKNVQVYNDTSVTVLDTHCR